MKRQKQIRDYVLEARQANEATQLNLFHDKVAEKDVSEFQRFAVNYKLAILDYLNKAYKAIAKNNPTATEEQKSMSVAAPAFSEPIMSQVGDYRIVTGYNFKLANTKLHSICLDKAIADAQKSKVNKFNNKTFCTFKLAGGSIVATVDANLVKDIKQKASKA